MFAGDANRVGPPRVGRKDRLAADVVLPPGAEVIDAGEAITWVQPDAGHGDSVRVTGAGGAAGAAAVVFAMNAEAVEMDIFPAHCDLDDAMELRQRPC